MYRTRAIISLKRAVETTIKAVDFLLKKSVKINKHSPTVIRPSGIDCIKQNYQSEKLIGI